MPTVQQHAPDAPETTEPGETPAGESTPAKSETLLRADFERWSDSFAKKINGELASLRKKGSPSAVTAAPDSVAEPKAEPLTVEDLKIYREIGRLEESVGQDMIDGLGEDYAGSTPAQQILILRGVQVGLAKTNEGSRGATPVVKPRINARAEAPVPRDTTPRPRSQQEHQALRSSNPRAFKALMAEDNYDPGKLPWSV